MMYKKNNYPHVWYRYRFLSVKICISCTAAFALNALRPSTYLSLLRIVYTGSIVELDSSLPSTPQHIPLSHGHVPAAQHRVRREVTPETPVQSWRSGFNFYSNVYASSKTRSEALFLPVLSWLMFVWINIEQEAMLAQGVSGRQEVRALWVCFWVWKIW